MTELNILGMPIEPVTPVIKEDDSSKTQEASKDAIDYSKIDYSKIDLTKVPGYSDMSKNLSEQGKIIKRLEKDNANKVKPEPKPVFDKIRYSKDLTPAEREGMSGDAIRLMDELAETRARMNEMIETYPEGYGEEEEQHIDTGKLIQDAAMHTAEGDWKKANQLIEKFKMAGFDMSVITSVDDAKVKMEMLKSLIPDFIPQKEQSSQHGTSVKAGSGKADDFKSLIDDVAKSRSSSAGSYQL